MSTEARFAGIGVVVAVVVFVASFAVIPIRVTFGTGSVRCGTALHPDREGEVADACPRAGYRRVREAMVVGALVLVVGLLPLGLRRWTARRRWLQRVVVGATVAAWALVLPLGLWFLTGAQSAG